MSKRRQPNLTELLGTALLQLFPDAMTFEEAKALTPKQIVARFRKSYDVHHWTYVAVLGGSNHPVNMSWMLAAQHDERTRKIDVPTIAKLKRGARKRTITDADILAHDDREAARLNGKCSRKPRGKLPNRAFPKPPAGAKYDWKAGRYARPT